MPGHARWNGEGTVRSEKAVPDKAFRRRDARRPGRGCGLIMYSIRASELHIRGEPAIRGTPAGWRQGRRSRKNGMTLIRAVSHAGACSPVLLAQVRKWCGILGHQDGINGTHRQVRAPDYTGDASDDDYHRWTIPGSRAIHFAQKLQWRRTRFRTNRWSAARC